MLKSQSESKYLNSINESFSFLTNYDNFISCNYASFLITRNPPASEIRFTNVPRLAMNFFQIKNELKKPSKTHKS